MYKVILITFTIGYLVSTGFCLNKNGTKKTQVSKLSSYQIYYQWKMIDYAFKSKAKRRAMIKSGEFIQKNNMVTAVKVYKNRMFLTTPRYQPGVPSTFNVVLYDCDYYAPLAMNKKSPKLKPFPSWEMQKVGDCSALQLVQAMGIDQYGRLWIVDAGRTEAFTSKPNNRCPAKIVVVDLENDDKILFTYEFPENVVSRTSSLLKDINLACTSRKKCFGYIVDISDNKLIVFDYKRKRSWALKHSSMLPDPAKSNFTINGTPTNGGFGIASSSLSPKRKKFDVFYYAPIASTTVYSVSTSFLKSPPQNRNLKDEQIIELGVRSGQSDGWAMDSLGNLYMGNLPQSAVYITKVNGQQRLGVQKKIAQSAEDLSWPDTFGFDNYGSLLLTSDRFQLFDAQKMNFKEYNYRVVRFLTKTSAYSTNRRRICRPRTSK